MYVLPAFAAGLKYVSQPYSCKLSILGHWASGVKKRNVFRAERSHCGHCVSVGRQQTHRFSCVHRELFQQDEACEGLLEHLSMIGHG